jgi:hypothetical protein
VDFDYAVMDVRPVNGGWGTNSTMTPGLPGGPYGPHAWYNIAIGWVGATDSEYDYAPGVLMGFDGGGGTGLPHEPGDGHWYNYGSLLWRNAFSVSVRHPETHEMQSFDMDTWEGASGSGVLLELFWDGNDPTFYWTGNLSKAYSNTSYFRRLDVSEMYWIEQNATEYNCRCGNPGCYPC